jgi:hypothetical protein
MIQEAAMKNVVVIFQATQRETESLALAFGLGAVQAGADIRLRHLDPSPATMLAHDGYGTLRVADLRWAEGVAVFLESNAPTGLGELRSAVEAIAEAPDNNSKVIYLFHPDQSAESFRLLESMASQFGFQRLADLGGTATTEHMTEMGRRLVGNSTEKL